MKTFVIVCKGITRGEEWFLGEGEGYSLAEAIFHLATKDPTFRVHYDRHTNKFWGQPVNGRVMSKAAVA